MFDPEWEKLGVAPHWVRLPGLPLHLWFDDIFKHIGNELGTYLDHEKSYITSRNMSLARILVHLDTREGMEEQITIYLKHFTRI